MELEVEQYVHTLMPRAVHFSPRAEQVIRFADGLSAVGAAPRDAEISVRKPSGSFRTLTHPITGEQRSFPASERITFKNTTDVASMIGTLEDYSVVLDGWGPPELVPFLLFFHGALCRERYGFTVRCCARAEPVSMSDESFDDPCTQQDVVGFSPHPITGKLIKLNPGCARFWVEFEFGRFLLPQINDSFDILNPAIVALAQESFGLEFAQGCYFL